MNKRDLLKKGMKDDISLHTKIFNDIKNININNIKLNPFQPRKSFDDENIQELANSIKDNGLLQPISITKDNILIAGERRLRACKILKLEKIKCIIIQNIDNDKLERLAIIENLQREDLNIFDESEAIGKLVQKNSIRTVATMLNKSKGYIADRNIISKIPNLDKDYAKEHSLKHKDLIKLSQLGLDEYKSVRQADSINYDNSDQINEVKPKFKKPKTDLSKHISTQNKNQQTMLNDGKIEKYKLTNEDIETKKQYSDNGFLILFSNDEIAIKGNKKAFDVYAILEMLKNNNQ